jgi:hypothetical protein
MNVMLLNGSPKKRFRNSGYFLNVLKWQLSGCQVESYRIMDTKAYGRIFSRFPSIDALVIAMPVYVDAVPSHVLKFLIEAEKVCREQNCGFKLYIISNCGFFEGKQTRNQLNVMRCWCHRAGIEWGRGVGIGGGEMLACIQLIPILAVLSVVLRLTVTVISYAASGELSPAVLTAGVDWISFLIDLLVFVSFSFGLLSSLWKLKRSIKTGTARPDIITGLTLCPKFVFVLCANLFWLIRAAFHGVGIKKIFRKADSLGG